ncbi:penicillin-binding protein, partial [Bacteroidota bacterium]
WKSKASILSLKDITIEPNRGDIYSYDGRLLASSVPHYEIYIDLHPSVIQDDVFNKNIDSLSIRLSKLFKDKTYHEYKRNLLRERKKKNRFYLIQRNVTYIELKELRSFPLFRLGRYKGGLIVHQENERILPHGKLARRTIGYLTETGIKVGLEGAYDHYIKGIVGLRLMQKLSGGVWMPVDNANEVEPKDGYDIITTIDIKLQDVAEYALEEQLRMEKAHHGCVIVMEVKTGEIRAIANLQRDKDGSYSESYNYAIGESTEPGSTFKLISFLAALEDGYIDLDDTIHTGKGVKSYYDVQMTDSRKEGYGVITVKEVFAYSSNVGVSRIITRYYKGRESNFIDRLYSMNLNEKLGIEIPGEGEPFIKYPGEPSWSGTTLPWMSIGYEVRMTPLQLLTVYNAVANDGTMVKPQFVKAIAEHGKIIRRIKPEIISHSICSKSTIKKSKEMLEYVVEAGTARNLRNLHYKIAGKTGTAQIANKNYGYKNMGNVSYQASFVGYFPADNPKYSCIVVVNSPSQNVYYGNLVAGPVFKEISDKVYATSIELNKNTQNELAINNGSNIPYSLYSNWFELTKVLKEVEIPFIEEEINSDWVVTFKTDSCINIQNRIIRNGIVPNIIGMGIKDALYILENSGLEVFFKGKGMVREQSIQPGVRIKKGDRIYLNLG